MGKITLDSKEYEKMFQKATGVTLFANYINSTDVVDREMCGLLLGFKVEEVEKVENKMAVDSLWRDNVPEEAKEKLNSAGYREFGTDAFVPEEDAYEYALERISQDEDLKKELVEWFYSGNWIREE